jgi:ribosomal protein S27AE
MAHSHWLRRKRVKSRRTFAGADLAKRLVKWLDANEGSEASARIVDLLGDFQTVAKLMRPMGMVNDVPVERGRFIMRGRLLSPGGQTCIALAGTLNRKLARYAVYPQFAYGMVEQHWLFLWKSAKRKYGYVRPVDPSRLSEAEAALRVVDLAREGYVTRVRQCPCGKGWFFAKFRHQVFCGLKCQQQYFRTSEQFKAKRRVYMRKYRELVQSTNVK